MNIFISYKVNHILSPPPLFLRRVHWGQNGKGGMGFWCVGTRIFPFTLSFKTLG